MTMIERQSLTTHSTTTANYARREIHEGREHLVAPVTAIIEGVLNGELAPAEEIGRYVNSWNGIPLPINHPTKNNVPVSANSPDLIQSQSVGRFFNARFDGKALKGEIWVDIDKATNLGGEALEVINRLENGLPLEVSTAYFNDIEEVSGTFNGKSYNGIQRNLRPDHLALLPNDIGACSFEDGCGVRANSKERSEGQTMFEKFKHFMANFLSANQDVSHNEISELLESAMTREKGDNMRFLIRERYDNHFIYQESTNNGFDGRMFKREYQIDANNNVQLGKEEEVRRVVSYEPTGNAASEEGDGQQEETMPEDQSPAEQQQTEETITDNKEEKEMAKEQLKANCSCGGGSPAANETAAPKAEGNQTAVTNAPSEPAVNNEQPKAKTMEQWLQEIPDEETRNFIINSQKKQKANREKLITSLSANSRCAFEEDELKEMSTNALEKLDKSLAVEDYSGMGGPRVNSYSQNDDDEVPAAPSILFAANKKEDE